MHVKIATPAINIKSFHFTVISMSRCYFCALLTAAARTAVCGDSTGEISNTVT